MMADIGYHSLDVETFLSSIPVEGNIPHWLEGTLLRNGPAKFHVKNKVINWFDGLAMLHAFSFHKGRVSYANHFLRTDAYRSVFEKGAIDYLTFMQDPCKRAFKSFLTLFWPKRERFHNANVNIARMAGRYVALTETPLPVEFDKHTLETLGLFNYDDQLPHQDCFESAHPHFDAERKEFISYLVKFGKVSEYQIYSMKETSKTRELLFTHPAAQPSYMHSFAITPNYLIFAAYPFCVKPLDLLLKNKPFIQNFSWNAANGTEFLIFDRKGKSFLKSIKTDAFFSFHHVNAYEHEREIVVDLVSYPDPRIITDMLKKKEKTLKDADIHPQLVRYHLSLMTGRANKEVLFAEPLEFPRIAYHLYNGRKYQYLYAADARAPKTEKDKRPLYKIDVSTGKALKWEEAGCFPGEPVFVPKHPVEDEGVVLAVVLDAKTHTSFLLVLDAATFTEIGRAIAPHPIPFGLHGDFFL